MEPPEGWYHVGLCRLADFFSNHNYKKVKDLAEIIVRIIFTAVRLHVFLVLVNSIEQELKIQ